MIFSIRNAVRLSRYVRWRRQEGSTPGGVRDVRGQDHLAPAIAESNSVSMATDSTKPHDAARTQ